jgi:2,3-diaminopropionate biosynthesis protein SbnB
VFDFHVIDGAAVREIIANSRSALTDQVRDAYLAHDAGEFHNPGSSFLRFADKPDSRIIALPAYLGGDYDIAGLKWIASFPANIAANVPRASAVLLLNDGASGYPFACLEAAQISAARTAASAVGAAETLRGGRSAARIAVAGAGVIARTVIDFFAARGWAIDRIDIHDRQDEYAALLAGHATTAHGYEAAVAPSLGEAVRGADIVLFATTAGEPYVLDPRPFGPGQLVLNISLRDLAPEIIVGAHNVLDSVEHCLTANTSPHLAEQVYRNRDFVTGTIAQALRGELDLTGDRPVIFSPFGMGVLDLVVGWSVYRAAVEAGRTHVVADFFGQTERWEPAQRVRSDHA